jgi:hypothetical protein
MDAPRPRASAGWLARFGHYAAQVVEDIHDGLIAGFDRLWYG